MSRVANSPVALPKGVDIQVEGAQLSVKGGKGSLDLTLTDGVGVNVEQDVATITYDGDSKRAMAGTTRSLLANMVKGVSEGWEKRLVLNGVGYRAKASGKSVNLTIGLSHQVDYQLAEGLSADTPSQTEIVISGIDKQAVGQAAAEIRSFRPPEPYKGKGIRYADEYVRRKEAKKKIIGYGNEYQDTSAIAPSQEVTNSDANCSCSATVRASDSPAYLCTSHLW